MTATPPPPPGSVVVRPVRGMPEVGPGDDLADLIATHAAAGPRRPDPTGSDPTGSDPTGSDTTGSDPTGSDPTGSDFGLADGDILVVSSKIVSKAEGRIVPAAGPSSSPAARADAVRSEAVRIVAERGTTQIVQTRHGFVMAAAGVDNSNVAAGSLLLLPEDPDASARELRHGLARRLGLRLGVIVTDTFGRPWRLGQTDLAIGAAGVRVADDHRGRRDVHGNELAVTAPAHADELAAAGELVKGKLSQVPVAVVRGLAALVTPEDGPGVRALVRPAEDDMFRLGSREAGREAVRPRRVAPELADVPADPDAVRRARSAIAGDLADTEPSWGLVEVEEAAVRKPLLDTLGLPSSLPYVLLLHVRTDEPAARTAALLQLGGVRDRLALSCAVEGLGSRWLSADSVDAALLRPLVPHGAETVGLLAVGVPLPD